MAAFPSVRCSKLASERDNQPALVTVSWTEFLAWFETPRRGPCAVIDCLGGKCQHKRGPAWTPAIYPPGLERGQRNVAAVGVLALDIDHQPDNIVETLAEKLEGLRYVVHSTHSDRPGDRCLRVLLFLSREVLNREWSSFRDEAIKRLGLPVDPATRDASRLFYLPSCPADGEYFFAYESAGEVLDVDDVLAACQTRQDAPGATFSESVGGALPPASFELLQRVLNDLTALGPAIEGQGGDKRTYQAAAIARHGYGLSEDEAYFVLSRWNQTCQPPWSEAELRTKIANAEKYAEGAYGASRRGVETFAHLVGPGGDTKPQKELPDEIPFAEVIARRPMPVLKSYSTGLYQLDNLLGGGVKTRQLTAVCGPPAAGKSSLGITIARHLQAERLVLYASTELESYELVARLAAPVIKMPWREVAEGAAEQVVVHGAVKGGRVVTVGCEILPRDAWEAVDYLKRMARWIAQREGQTPIVFVDYLQDLATGSADQLATLGALAASFRIMAQELDTPVVTIVSVSRTYYGQARQELLRQSDDPTTYLAAAKASGDIDYAAAVVVYLDVDTSHGDDGKPGRIAIAKARTGRTGFVGVRFWGAEGYYVNDPEAATQMGAQRKERKEQAKTEADDQSVLDAVEEFRRSNEYLTRTSLHTQCGLSKGDAWDAIKRLISTGKLVTRFVHPFTHKSLKHPVLDLPDTMERGA